MNGIKPNHSFDLLKEFGLNRDEVQHRELLNNASQQELKSILGKTRRLSEDIKVVKDDFHVELTTDVKTYLCLDCDVIQSAVDWTDNDSLSSFWATLLFDFEQYRLLMLPGTLFELRKLLRRKSRESPITVSTAFEKFFRSLELSEIAGDTVQFAGSEFQDNLIAFSNKRTTSDQLYILRKVKKNLGNVNAHQFPAIDSNFFESCVSILAIGTRVDKSINNRVDAVNYSLCHTLNRKIRTSNNRYLFVSDTPAVRRVDSTLSGALCLYGVDQHFEHGFVRSSRTIAMQLLIREIGESVSGAYLICYHLLDNLVQYSRSVAEIIHAREIKRSNRLAITKMEIEPANPIVDLISSIDALQVSFDEAKTSAIEQRETFYRDNFLENKSDSFYIDMGNQLNQILNGQEIRDSVNKIELKKGGDLKLEVSNTEDKFGFIEQRVLTDEFKGIVAAGRRYESDAQYLVIRDVSLVQFIAVYNSIVSSISASISIGEYKGDKWSLGKDRICIVAKTLENPFLLERESRSDHNIDELSEAAKIYPSDIVLLSIDNDLFSVSCEQDLVAFTTAHDLKDEIQLFFDLFLGVQYKSDQFRDLIPELIIRESSHLIPMS